MEERLAYYPVGTVNDFPAQIGRVAHVGELEVAIFLSSTGEIYAVENKNPHPKGGPLAEGIISGAYLYDPLYDWKIDLRTGLVQAPDEGKVRTFPVIVKAGIVFVGAVALEPAAI
ncbi:nitrite reductase (NAD(P)H) small subunit [Paenibacillus zeisoli]|uniref:Nitrite reductase (NAD(P)H) small subunit n=1 Tax=Paenibacillus zeisoli TaxID=2496267 RepID=A0A3S1BWU8_9BACL|nr:nitrite reductase (NAD(P)H) small subunit [Paenibacillus zeisoli]RUT36210.1 nitrite reductase (NAD(P)H) small subunit [Paenibacillus zeisoli]